MQDSSRRHLLASVVYVSAALLLVCLAALAGSFSKTVGDARISGRFSPFPLFNRSRLQEVTLSWNGLNLRFSRVSTPALVGLDVGDGTADIVLEGNERLHLSAQGGAASSLTLSRVSASATSEALSIPFRISGVLRNDGNANSLSWRQGSGEFRLSLPSDSTIDFATNAITLQVTQAAPSPEIRLVSLAPAKLPEIPAPSARLPDEKSLPTPDQLTATLARFADSAYTGWSLSRFSQSDGTWKMPDGKPGFSEDIGIGLLAESIARGTFTNALQAWTGAVNDQLNEDPPPRLSFAACAYTGDVRGFVKFQQDRDASQVDKLKGLSAQGDPSLLARPGVLLYALDRGGPALAKTVVSSLRALDPGKLSASQLLTFLEALEDYAQYVSDDPTMPPAAQDVVQKRLLPLLVATNDGSVFLASQPGSVDVKESIRCGSLLIRAGALLQSSFVAALGRGLVASSVVLASDAGFLPASLSIASARVTSRTGTIAPESVYAMLPLDRLVPHEVPLYRLMGAGCWVWTAADLVSAQQVGGEIRLVFEYPAGIPHHLVIRGLRGFQQIRLHGIAWHADPSYAKYSDGWFYDEDGKTLFMKITGKQDKEEVDFTF
ncbi:MAG TPA: hypothetical protein VL354_11265 [Spirochaetia bacterium]|nr:hypothetical protein [Spirochaetia bacterium]